VLGTIPLSLRRPLASDALKIIIAERGWRSETVALSADTGAERTVRLERVVPRPGPSLKLPPGPAKSRDENTEKSSAGKEDWRKL
jgi:hypothetical protein